MIRRIKSIVENADKMSVKVLREYISNHPGSKLSDKIRWFLDTEDITRLKSTNKAEMLAEWINKSQPKRVPVLKVSKQYKFINDKKRVVGFTTKVVESDMPGDEHMKEGIYYSREWIPGLVKMSADEQTVSVYNVISKMSEDHVVYFPERYGAYSKVSGMGTKGMYFIKKNIPNYLSGWVSSKIPKIKNDLGTLLKRQGKKLECLSNLKAYKEFRATELYGKKVLNRISEQLGGDFDVADRGTIILTPTDWKKLEKELGIELNTPLQGTIIGDNWYFKGTINSTKLTGAKPGYYGGVKRCSRDVKVGRAILGSVFAAYTSEPWGTTLNRQICDYVPSMDFPVSMEAPTMEETIKAHMGIKSKRIGFNYKILSGINKSLNKINIDSNKSWAGKISLIDGEGDYMFVIKGNEKSIKRLNGQTIDMAMLIFPWLATYRHIPKVKVKMVYDKNIDNHLISVNVNSENIEWVAKWFMSFYGRDFDGDGLCLTFDDRVLKHAVTDDSTVDEWMSTTSVKDGVIDKVYSTSEEAIKAAEQMIKIGSRLIGKYDMTARSIIYMNNSLMTKELSNYIAMCIQLAISSQKKHVPISIEIRGKKYKWRSTSWMYRAGFMSKDEYKSLFKGSTHNAMSSLASDISDYITQDIAIRRKSRLLENGQGDRMTIQVMVNKAKKTFEHLEKNVGLIPEKYGDIIEDLMGMLLKTQSTAPEVKAIKSIAEDVMLKYDGTDIRQQIDIAETMAKIKSVAYSNNNDEDDEKEKMSYGYTARYINHTIANYKGNKRWLIASILKESNSYLMSMLDIKWFDLIGYKIQICIPSVRAGKIGTIVSKGQLMALQGAYRDLPNGDYELIASEAISKIQWFTKSGNHKNSQYMLSLAKL